jgi:hypothetical protein
MADLYQRHILSALQMGGHRELRLTMCSLTPKREFHLYGAALLPASDDVPATASCSTPNQMAEVHQLLQSLKASQSLSGEDPRRKLMAALAHAALSQVRTRMLRSSG